MWSDPCVSTCIHPAPSKVKTAFAAPRTATAACQSWPPVELNRQWHLQVMSVGLKVVNEAMAAIYERGVRLGDARVELRRRKGASRRSPITSLRTTLQVAMRARNHNLCRSADGFHPPHRPLDAGRAVVTTSDCTAIATAKPNHSCDN